MKSKSPSRFGLLLVSFFYSLVTMAQGPGSLFVDAGPDVTADCTTGGCADITATFLETYDTSGLTYDVVSVPYTPPFAFNGLANSLNPNIDDAWSPVDTLPFDFCFFGDLETEFQVGSNGVLRFDVDPNDTFNAWSFSSDIPNNTEEALAEANVFTPGHDIDPAASNSEEIGYEVLGTFPNRVLVVSYYEVPMFSGTCNNLLATHMAVFYEFSNVIEIYMQDKPSCPTWNSGNAALGIQNDDGDTAYVPPGRNTSDSPWTATNEAWSFSPVGPPTYVFEWLDSMGTVIGTTPTINVCVTGTETFTARVTYTNTCNGEVVILTDDVDVTADATFTVDLGPDIETCSSTPILLDADTMNPAVTYQWYLDGVAIVGATNPTYTATAPNSGTYSVIATDGICDVSDDIIIIFNPDPQIADPPNDLFICDDGVNPGIFDLTVNSAVILGPQDPALFNITYHNSQADADAGINAIVAPNVYPITGTLEVIYIRIEDLSGMCFNTAFFEIEFMSSIAGAVTSPYYICDQDQSGDETINLTALFNIAVLNGADPFLYNVSYHLSQADADANLNPLPATYTVSTSPLIIYIRLENDAHPSCYDTTQTVEIILDGPPVVNTPIPLLVCDIDNDGFAEFTLHDADLDITGGNPDYTVTYHPTQSDADNNINELFDPYTNDDPYNDVVFARIESTVNICYNTIELELEVRDTPMVLEPSEPLRLCDYNNPGDGLEVFDLTLVEMEVLNGLDPLLYDFYYYELEADAITAGDLALTAPDFSLAIGAPTTYQNVTPLLQVVYILVVGNPSNTSPNNGAQGCYAIVPLTLVVDPLPVAVQALPYELCDDDLNGSTLTDQISTFDLTTREDEITGGDPTLSVSWYETPADELADNPIVNPSAYQNREIPPAPLNPQTIVARVTSAENCNVTTTLTLVVNPNPSPVTPTPLEVCDDDNDGFALFTLEDKDIEIIGGEPGVGVVYYLTQIDAQLGDPAGILVSPYANVVANLQTVWARVENATTGCYSVVGLDLVVNPLPDEPVVPGFGDLTSCDGDGSGSALFNLEDNNVFVYGVQDPLDFSISYHTDQAEAEAGINPVGNPTVFSSTGQTIWVRLENNTTGCYRVSSFELIVGVFPLIATPDDMEACDDLAGGSTTDGIAFFDLTLNDAFITMGDPDLSVFYYETAADQAAGIFIDPATSYENLTNPMTLFVSVFNSTGCWAETTLTLFVNPTPTPVTPTPMEVCDDNNDGFSEFMLTDKDAEIIGGEPDVLISYHETLVDAQNGVFALTSPYANITAYTQVVYARAYFAAPPDGTGCYAVVELELIVNDHPVVPLELPALVLCDDDGFAIFDLTQQDSLIYGTQDPSLYTLTYHISLADAQAGVNPIGTPGAFPNTVTPEQTIYYRLSVNESGCFSTGEFLLQVSIGPMVNQPEPLTLCDDLGEPNDGITSFDLTVKTDEITGGVMGVEVRYYETQQDADDDTNRIDPETAYVNLTNPQTLYVRVIDGNTECYDTSVTLNIRVSPNPTPVTPAPIELCDDNDPGDEIEVFDLTVRESEILNGANWELLYYEVLEDAIEGDPALAIVDPTMYSNTSNPQTIYVRVTIPVSSSSPYGCFEIVELELIVHPIPDDSAIIEPYRICEIGSDGLFIFDLTTKIDEILAGQDPLLFSVSFYHSSADAIAGLNPIINTTTYQNMTNPETIFTGIANIETGCYIGGVQFFDLEVLEGAAATTPAEPYTICDNTEPNDGIADFTLYNLPGDPDPDPQATALANEILGGQPNPPYDLQFYETFAQADLGDVTLALPSVYTNVINPQVIYARVTNLDTDCYEIVEVILKVEQLPLVVLDEQYRLCVDINGNPIPEEEGAMSPPVIDTGLDPGLFDIVWQYPGGTAVGPSIIALEEGVYSVTYTEIATGCSGTATTTVVVSQPPIEYDAFLVNGAFSEQHVIQATASGLGTYVFQLDNGAFIDSGLWEDVTPGVHTITIKDVNGCGSVTLELGVIDYPRFVTPNNDGYHDTWNIIGIAQFDPTAKIYIFDRFGKLLKQVSPLGEGWNGTYNSNPLPSSDYWFLIEYTEDEIQKELKGHFTLKR